MGKTRQAGLGIGFGATSTMAYLCFVKRMLDLQCEQSTIRLAEALNNSLSTHEREVGGLTIHL